MLDVQTETIRLVEDYRHRCLWFLRPDYYPSTKEEVIRTLDLIERYGDREAFLRAEEIKRWLSHSSNPES